MKKRTVLTLLLAVVCCLCFLLALQNLEETESVQGIQVLEEAVRRAAVTCYALEGAYPSEVSYLCRHYGLTYDQTKYTVHYEIFASNMMPDITVLERIS